ncbi:MAG: APC family permease [Actinomycetota bacterium]|nr:APC family permease [Actinomycetota bacterium]
MTQNTAPGKGHPAAERSKRLGLLATIAIGIGGMVGGGIFSVLGLTVQVAGSAAYLAFVVSGLAALLTGYSYAKLSVRYPSRGGTVAFLNRAYKVPFFAGWLNVLLWLGYFVMLALYAFAFGSYLAELVGQPTGGLWHHIFTSGVVVGFTLLNFLGSAIVGRAESALVYFKIAILLFFTISGLFFLDPNRVTPSTFPGLIPIVFGGTLIYLAYEGFELIANAAEDVDRPERTLPRAYYICILFVIALYVLVAFVAVGNLSPAQIVQNRDYALAAAAQPFLGTFGFTLIGIAAVVSTASALNATLYGAAKFTYVIAQSGELPQQFARNIWNRPIAGLLATAAGTLLIANTLDIEGISLMGSAAFLIIFAFTNLANVRLAHETNSSRALSLLAAVVCTASLAALTYYATTHVPAQLLVLAGMVILAIAIEAGFLAARRTRHAGH